MCRFQASSVELSPPLAVVTRTFWQCSMLSSTIHLPYLRCVAHWDINTIIKLLDDTNDSEGDKKKNQKCPCHTKWNIGKLFIPSVCFYEVSSDNDYLSDMKYRLQKKMTWWALASVNNNPKNSHLKIFMHLTFSFIFIKCGLYWTINSVVIKIFLADDIF